MNTQMLPQPGSADLVVGLVGCGVMGRGIAQIAVLSGATVRMFDTREGGAEAAHKELTATFGKLVEKGKLDAAKAEAAGQRLQACPALEQLAGCHVIVEAIVEDLAAKRSLFASLEQVAGPDAILATNTSSLPVTAIAAGLQRPERVAGFHFFNPVPLMKIVEVIGGFLTDAAVVDYMLALGAQWGHAAVRAKDTPGFIVNHAGRGYGTEGLRILNENIASVPALDAILRDTAGFRLGPCELLDLTGLDVSHPVMESIYQQYYEEPRFRPQVLTRQMLTAGALGRKTGHGFYHYPDGKKQEIAEPQQASARPRAVWLSNERPEMAERVANLVSAAGVSIESGSKPSDDALCIVTPLGEDVTTCCAREGLDPRRTVGVEALFDASKRRVVMTNPATTAEALAQAVGVLNATGVPVSVIRDSAGLVTQRVVAHIVNVACEIAQQDIAAPEDIDRAVTLGLGYPVGPLTWGDRLGPMTVLTILKNLEQLTGDARYRASPWLQRRALLGLSLQHKEI
ncbi:3-hydroxyacyl-CoA dehydrogenase [Noviherbaspirillum galbum]|uniref:3-hydroxyacyl-CoA dehydrogenase n=1 Tax=Noviherbaspirillum galbum TaxID=2709383 RepID=A0A6B3SJN2_9BURK|nr:3-hydroxyacyl-CoA dehydrogenase [Noviherbaspirillum galbum]NEX60778.1 3-hydroxyacyl-CoA dehydrogenase [Noviherbaspirillum galbum]